MKYLITVSKETFSKLNKKPDWDNVWITDNCPIHGKELTVDEIYPKEIWLQIGAGQEDEEATWAEHKINDTDICYYNKQAIKQLLLERMKKQ